MRFNKKNWNIRELYPYNIIEGEGAGTSYEYAAKTLALRDMWKRCTAPQSILIAGLPQIYGLSFDFLIWGQVLNCPVTIIEDRKEIIEKLHKCLEKTDIPKPRVIHVDSLEAPQKALGDETFDIVFSCEVLQRLENKAAYIKEISKRAQYLALFVPNKGNISHDTKSGLGTLSLEELTDLSKQHSGKSLFAEGYIDFPPWPPGIKRSDEKREQAEHGFMAKRFLDFCEIWVRIEKFIPFTYRHRYSHIVYALLEPAS